MNENGRRPCVCIELVTGILVNDVIIEVSVEANEDKISGSGCELPDSSSCIMYMPKFVLFSYL